MTGPVTPAPRRGRWTAALVLLLVALAGVAGGIALDRAVLLPRAMHAHMAAMDHERMPRRREFARTPGEFRHRLAEELQLTAEQRARIDSLLDAQRADLEAIRGTTHPRIESVIAGTRREIEAVLTPEQRERMAELGERRRRMRRDR